MSANYFGISVEIIFVAMIVITLISLVCMLRMKYNKSKAERLKVSVMSRKERSSEPVDRMSNSLQKAIAELDSGNTEREEAFVLAFHERKYRLGRAVADEDYVLYDALGRFTGDITKYYSKSSGLRAALASDKALDSFLDDEGVFQDLLIELNEAFLPRVAASSTKVTDARTPAEKWRDARGNLVETQVSQPVRTEPTASAMVSLNAPVSGSSRAGRYFES